MRRPSTIAVTCVLACALLLPAAGSAEAGPSGLMVRKINNFRASHGQPRLNASRSLRRSARRYARWMIAHDYFGHVGRIRMNRRFRVRGENIAMHPGCRSRVTRTFRAWKRSPGHRALMLSRRFRSIGAARACGGYHGRRATMWVAHFGRR